MKLLHIADLHLDSPFTGLTKQLHSLQKHLIQSPYQAFERCVSIAINQAVDLMVIAGDIYDTEQQTVTAQHFFLKQLERLHIAKIPVVLCHGNHDYLRMECQSVPYPDNVHLFKDQEVTAIDIPLADDQTVRCYGFSYTKRWVDARMIDSYPVNPHETTYTLGVLHGQESGDHYAPFDLESLLSKNYDYWALGHIHQAQVLKEQPLIQYPGTIQGRHRKELGDKGAFIVELKPQTPAKSQFISLAPIVWQEAHLECRSNWHELDLVQALEGIQRNYQAEAEASNQSQLVTVVLDHYEKLPANLASQVESSEVLAALQADVVNTPFVALVSLQTVSQVAIEPFQYDASLKDSFDQASQALKTGDLYGRVMQPLFSNATLRTWLGDLTQDQELKDSVIHNGQQLVVQAVGFEADDEDLTSGEEGTAHED